MYEPSLLDKCEQGHGEWQKVRLMPTFLRIFTRVNHLAFFGEHQGMEWSTSFPCMVQD